MKAISFNQEKSLEFIRSLPDISSVSYKLIHLPKPEGYRKTLVIDLDETLVHCPRKEGEIEISVRFASGRSKTVGINLRPHVQYFLAEVSKLFEVIVFTAAHKCYADAVLDFLDPSNQLIHHRLYRNSCTLVKGEFLKDLRILANRNLSDIVIVDNQIHAFAFQIDNGILISSWYNDHNDSELLELLKQLETIHRG